MSRSSGDSPDLTVNPTASSTVEQLVGANLALAKFLATEKARRVEGSDLGELMSAAHFGLVRAAREFDPNKGTPFGAFARHYIRWELSDALRKLDPAGERMRTRINTLRDARTEFQRDHGEDGTHAELAELTGIDESRVAEAFKIDAMIRSSVSYESFVEEGAELTVVDQIIMPEHMAERSENRRMLVRMTEALPEAMRTVIEAAYFGDESDTVIAEKLGVSRPRVNKVRSMALRLMREALDAWNDDRMVDAETSQVDAPQSAKRAFYGALWPEANRDRVSA